MLVALIQLKKKRGTQSPIFYIPCLLGGVLFIVFAITRQAGQICDRSLLCSLSIVQEEIRIRSSPYTEGQVSNNHLTLMTRNTAIGRVGALHHRRKGE